MRIRLRFWFLKEMKKRENGKILEQMNELEQVYIWEVCSVEMEDLRWIRKGDAGLMVP